MLAQVSTLRSLLNASEAPNLQWEALTRKFPSLDDIVEQCAKAENLKPFDYQQSLIRLYQTYVAEWDAVESEISANFSNQKQILALHLAVVQ
jgi:hypothetical protein